jgi:hypothetical protein
VALHHLAGDLDVDGVDVVEEAGGEEATDLEDKPGEGEDGDGAWAPEAGRCGLVVGSQVLVLCLRCLWFVEFI